MILDIDVRDRSGRPVPDLTQDDFALFLGTREWPIYAVDDLCPCSAGPAGVVLTEKVGRQHAAGAGADHPASQIPSPENDQATTPGLDPDPGRRHLQRRYVLYFDFSQLRADGRDRAFEASRRWLEQTRRPDDLVQLVTFVSRGGLQMLTDFTRDGDHLLSVLNAAEHDMHYVDTFPMQFFVRLKTCHDCIWECDVDTEISCPDPRGCPVCCTPCTNYAYEEHRHSQRSLRALRRYMSSLDDLAGRTELMYFHQNNAIDPMKFYLSPEKGELYGRPIISSPPATSNAGTTSEETKSNLARASSYQDTNMALLQEVGAAATAAGVRVHALSTEAHRGSRPPISDEAVTFGANLADYTGGTYSQASADLARLMDGPVMQCPCRYRISFEPPQVTATRMHKARVEVRGQRVPYSFRVETVTQGDRLVREAIAILDNPGSGTDFPVHVSLVPTRRTRGGWDVATSVLVELSALSLLKLPEGLEVQLDVGAVLYPQYDHGGGKVYEMFGGSRIRLREGSVLEQWLLHHREITGLRGGQYRLAGFIRNVGSGTFGGAEAIVTLPKAGDPALVGPFLYQSERPYFRSELPLLGKTGHTQASGIAASRGSLPAPPVLSQGSKVLFITWSCGALDRPVDLDQERIVRHIMKEGETLDALAAPHFIEAEENCLKVVDSLDTSRLPEGSFSYLVLKELDDGSPALSSQVAFEITAAR